MYLDKLTLNNFRSFAQAEVPFGKDLSLFVGENNGGKSNAIDAIRLLTARWAAAESSIEDHRYPVRERRKEIRAGRDLRGVEPSSTGADDIGRDRRDDSCGCVFGLKLDETTGRFPIRPALWAGHQRGDPEPGCHEIDSPRLFAAAGAILRARQEIAESGLAES